MEYVPPINGDTGNPDRPYINANPGTGIQGSIPPAAAIEHPMREIVNAITAAGLTPDPNDLTQLGQIISAATKNSTWDETTDPTADDDSSAGFLVGSFWRNGTSGAIFVCVDSTVGNAVWQRVNVKTGVTVGDVPVLVDADGNAGLPAISGKNLTHTDFEYVSAVDINNMANVTMALPAEYDHFDIDYQLIYATSGSGVNGIRCQLSYDGGSTFPVTDSYAGTLYVLGTSPTASSSNNLGILADYINQLEVTGNSRLSNVDGKYKVMHSNVYRRFQSNQSACTDTGIQRNTAKATHIRFLPSSGNFISGYVKLRAIR